MFQSIIKATNTTTLKIVGDVLCVLEGHVNPKVMHPIPQFRFALGSGSFSDASRLGETIVLESKPYVSWTEGNKQYTQGQKPITTPFLMGIERDEKPRALLYYRPPTPNSLLSCYEELANQYQEGFAVLGRALFSELHSTYIKKPPIYGENINENTSAYWAQVPIEKQTLACFFGVVIPPTQDTFPQKTLNRAFYKNPHETHGSPLMNHTHAAILKSGSLHKPKDLDDFYSMFKDQPISSVRHFLTQSLIQESVLAIFPLKQIIGC